MVLFNYANEGNANELIGGGGLSPFQQDEQNFLMRAEIFHRWAAGPDLAAQDVVEDLTHILFTLHTQTER